MAMQELQNELAKIKSEKEEISDELAKLQLEKEEITDQLKEIKLESRNKDIKFGRCQKKFLGDIKELRNQVRESESKKDELQAEVDRFQECGPTHSGLFESQIEEMSKDILNLKNENTQLVQDLMKSKDLTFSLDGILKKTQSLLSQVNIYKSQDERKLEFYEREIKNIELNSRRFLSIKSALSKIYEKDDDSFGSSCESNEADSFDAMNDDEVSKVVESILCEFVTFKAQHKIDFGKVLKKLEMTEQELMNCRRECKSKSTMIDNLSKQIGKFSQRSVTKNRLKHQSKQPDIKKENDFEIKKEVDDNPSVTTRVIRTNKPMTISTLSGVKISPISISRQSPYASTSKN